MGDVRWPGNASAKWCGETGARGSVRTGYRIGEWTFDLRGQTLQLGDQERPLTPKLAQLLEHLAAAAPAPLRRDQLLDLIWPEVVVCDHALHELVSQLRKRLNDDARTPRYLATLSRRGYRLIAPVSPLPGMSPRLRETMLHDRSITIGPMDDAGPAGGGRVLVDALIERFVRFPEIRLILPGDGESTGSATYALRVQSQPVGGQSSAQACLIRTEDRHIVWAETFATAELGSSSVAELAMQMSRRVRLRLICDRQCQSIRARARAPEAANLACAAVAMNYQINQAGTFEPDLMRVQSERAAEIDPGLVDGWQMLTIAYLWLGKFGHVPVEDAAAKCHEALRKAFALDPEDAYTHWLLGTTYVNLENAPDAAEEALSRAIAIDPLHPNAHWFHGMLGFVHRQRGDLTRAVDAHRRAVRNFDSDGRTQAEYAEVLEFAGHHERALQVAETALSLQPFPPSMVFAALAGFRALMSLGRRDAARAWVDEYLAKAEPGYHHHAAYMLAVLGREAQARAFLTNLYEDRPMQGYTLVLALLALGDLPAAVAAARGWRGATANSLTNRVKIDPVLAPVCELLSFGSRKAES